MDLRTNHLIAIEQGPESEPLATELTFTDLEMIGGGVAVVNSV
jgi:hypothetical protein